MDIKKFITNSNFDSDYNKIIKLEYDAIKNKCRNNNNILSLSDKTRSLYRVSDCNFFTAHDKISDIINDQNIIEFEEMCNDDIDKKTCLAYSGSMIKRYFDPNSLNINQSVSIENCYVVTLIDPSGTMHARDILKDKYKKNLEAKQGFYVIQTSSSLFCLDKKTSTTISTHILSNNDTMDRVALYDNDVWVSSLFILDFYKKISYYDTNNIDPVFGYPEDILGIYDRTIKNTESIKNTIDIVDFDTLQTISRSKIESTFIAVKENRYTVLEYLLTQMVDKNIHPIVSYQMKSMVLYLSNFQYFRPIFFVAKMTGFDKMYPVLYKNITDIKHKICIDPNVETNTLETLYHIDMYIINHLIKTDNDDIFVDYITKTGFIKKFKQESKTSEKIIRWIIEHKPIKIINILIDCMVLTEKHKYMIIFLTQEFSLLGKEFLTRYVLKRDPIVKKKKQNTIKRKKNKLNLIKQDVTESINISDTDDTDKNNMSDRSSDNISDNTPDSTLDNTSDIKNDDVTDNISDIVSDNVSDNISNSSKLLTDTPDSVSDNNSSDENPNNGKPNSYYQLDTNIQELILDVLPEVINRGLTRSFYMILKLCPYILDHTFGPKCLPRYKSILSINNESTESCMYSSLTGNILHMITSDKSIDIVEIIISKNPDLIDNKDNEGRTPLILYSVLGLNACINKLLDHGADYELIDNHSDTFLHKLCNNGYLNIVQNVIRRVTSIIDTKNDSYMTPAIVATSKGHEEIFYLLKGLNADLDTTDMYGNTVYHYICLSKICPGILVMNKKNKYGVTPYEYCKLAPKYYHFQS